MCDYCDCRRIPDVADPGAEYETIEELSDELLELVRTGSTRRGEAVERLPEVLDPHVGRSADPNVDTAALEGLFEDLHPHIAVEQYDLFPTAVQVLEDSRREATA